MLVICRLVLAITGKIVKQKLLPKLATLQAAMEFNGVCTIFFLEADKEAAVKTLVEGGVLPYLAKALESGACPAEKTAQLIAEVAKIGKYRLEDKLQCVP